MKSHPPRNNIMELNVSRTFRSQILLTKKETKKILLQIFQTCLVKEMYRSKLHISYPQNIRSLPSQKKKFIWSSVVTHHMHKYFFIVSGFFLQIYIEHYFAYIISCPTETNNIWYNATDTNLL